MRVVLYKNDHAQDFLNIRDMANYVNLLQVYCQEQHQQLPVYSTERAEGSSGGYASSVLVCDTNYDSKAIHSSKRLAEEDAARVAYTDLKRGSEPSSSSSRGRPHVSGLASRSAATSSYGYGGDVLPKLVDDSTAGRRTGLSARPVANGSGGSASAAAVDYSRKLEQLCNAQGLPPPEYDVQESAGGKFTATVTIGGEEYFSNNSESYLQAKDYGSLVALAEVGLGLLNISDREDGTEDNVERSLPRSDASSLPTSAESHVELPEGNYKPMINEYCQKNYLPLPEYDTEYPDDARGYVAVLTVNGKEYRSKPCPAKKKAEQDAAGRAALDIGLVSLDGGGGSRGGGSLASGLGSYSPANGSVSGLQRSRFTNGATSSHSYPSSSLVGGGASPRTSRFSARTAAVPENITTNYKGMLQEFLAKRGHSNPQYSTSQGNGGRFVTEVTLTDEVTREVMCFQGKAYANKKTAEQSAAKQACIHYNLE